MFLPLGWGSVSEEVNDGWVWLADFCQVSRKMYPKSQIFWAL